MTQSTASAVCYGAPVLSGKTIVVTGGGGPLGRILSEAFARAGGHVVLLDHVKAQPEVVAAEISKLCGASVTGLACDLLDEGLVRDAAAEITARGPVHALVHNAAFTGAAASAGWAVPFEEQDTLLWRKALEINLTAPFVLTQCLLPALRAAGSAAVLNVASIYGLVGPDWSIYEGTSLGNPAAYAASKGGLIQLTRWMATTLAPTIRVNALAAGGIERGHTDSFKRAYCRRTPMGRLATERDICGPALFLVSDQSAYVTGQVLAVDGGWTAW